LALAMAFCELVPCLDRTTGIADWSCLGGCAEAVARVVGAFSRWGTTLVGRSLLPQLRQQAPTLWRESLRVAQTTRVAAQDVFAANAYYDMSGLPLGCTAFAVDSARGPIHAHCLDWDDGAKIAREFATPVRFVADDGRDVIVSSGWPGFLGVLTGMAPGRFAA
jgi:hypothetical protein